MMTAELARERRLKKTSPENNGRHQAELEEEAEQDDAPSSAVPPLAAAA